MIDLAKSVEKITRPSRCDVCGGSIKRNYYSWTIDGQSRTVCPTCNRTMERRKSQAVLNGEPDKIVFPHLPPKREEPPVALILFGLFSAFLFLAACLNLYASAAPGPQSAQVTPSAPTRMVTRADLPAELPPPVKERPPVQKREQRYQAMKKPTSIPKQKSRQVVGYATAGGEVLHRRPSCPRGGGYEVFPEDHEANRRHCKKCW